MVLDEATAARWFLFAIAAGAVAYGIYKFLRREPPRSRPSILPAGRR